MFNIRKETFETNSSSTHSICITKEPSEFIDIPEEMTIELKNYNYEFGWESTMWDTPEEKLAYLIMGIIDRSYRYDGITSSVADIEKIINSMHSFGVKKVYIEGLRIVNYDGTVYLDNEDSYVDHGTELEDLIETVLNDESLLKSYLFDDRSFILGGNDNSELSFSINVDYPYIEIYKGN